LGNQRGNFEQPEPECVELSLAQLGRLARRLDAERVQEPIGGQ
jgi:hypothetical protein